MRINIQKVFLVVGLTLLFMLAGLLSVVANSYSQEQKFNISLKNVSISEVFNEIEKQSEFVIFYNENQ